MKSESKKFNATNASSPQSGKFSANLSNLKPIPSKTKPMQNPSNSLFVLLEELRSVLALASMQKISRNADESVAYIKVWVTEGRGVGEVIWGEALR
ncbi:MAG: hypothetical protein EBT92_14290 [Planctomycetes bacterium]|nr:hypothetical protein [Planctomycetota bacterium]